MDKNILKMIVTVIMLFACFLPIFKYDSKIILVTMGFCQGYYFFMFVTYFERFADKIKEKREKRNI